MADCKNKMKGLKWIKVSIWQLELKRERGMKSRGDREKYWSEGRRVLNLFCILKYKMASWRSFVIFIVCTWASSYPLSILSYYQFHSLCSNSFASNYSLCFQYSRQLAFYCLHLIRQLFFNYTILSIIFHS